MTLWKMAGGEVAGGLLHFKSLLCVSVRVQLSSLYNNIKSVQLPDFSKSQSQRSYFNRSVSET